MAMQSLGKVTVTTAGTPVRATSTQSTPGARVGCQHVRFTALAGNTGRIFIGDSTLVASTGVGVLGELPIPTNNIIPFLDFDIPQAPAGLNVADFYLDSTVNGEGVYIAVFTQ